MEEAKSTICQSLLLKSGNKYLNTVKDINYQQMNILAMSFKNYKQTKKLKQRAPKFDQEFTVKSNSISNSKSDLKSNLKPNSESISQSRTI